MKILPFIPIERRYYHMISFEISLFSGNKTCIMISTFYLLYRTQESEFVEFVRKYGEEKTKTFIEFKTYLIITGKIKIIL